MSIISFSTVNKYNNSRETLINKIIGYEPHFSSMSTLNQLKLVLNPTDELLTYVCDFIKQSLELRN